MAKTYEEVYAIKQSLEDEYADRHSAHRRLRQFWHGRYWEQASEDSNSVASLFRDVTRSTSEVGPDIKLVYNLLKDVCVKFQGFLSPLPMIKMYVDPPSTPTRRNQANLKEKFLYGTWSENNMSKVMCDQGWYLPLMGDAFLGSFPDFEHSKIRALLRSPEYAYPLQNFDGSSSDGVIFAWKVRESALRRQFPNYHPTPGNDRGRFSFSPRRPTNDPEVEVIEYSDKKCFYRWAGQQQVNGVEHDFGFDCFDHVKFINVPGEVWGHGAVEQSVNLVEMGNAYLSLMMQSAIENVFPVMVLEDPMKAPETIERGAGAVIPVNAGGKVYYLQPPAGNLLAQADWAGNIERMIKTDSSMPDVSFGVAENSIITGKAINELQGAGTGSLVEMVQGVGIGSALTTWNEKAITMTRQMFAEDKIRLFGSEAGGVADINPRSFALSLKGKELVGSTRNEVIFMPHIDLHTKVVVGLQLAGAGIVSRKWQRDQVGIPDSEAMDEEIVSEAIQDAVMVLLTQTITGENAEQVEEQAQDYIEGHQHPLTSLAAPPMPGTGPEPSLGGPPGDVPPGGGGGPPISELPGGGQIMSPAFQQPEGAPPPAGTPVGGAPGTIPGSPGSGVVLDQAISAIQQLPVQGQVFLVGEIVARGQVSDAVEVAVTDPEDRTTIANGVPFPVTFKVISGTPNEQFIEVTPGAEGAVQGENPTPEQVLA